MTIKFDMRLEQNFAVFYDRLSGRFVAVESFDNRHFEVQVGTLALSEPAGILVAHTDEELNEGLARILKTWEESWNCL